MRFLQKLSSFFYGRYGIDEFYYFLLFVFLILTVVQVLLNGIAWLIISIISSALLVFIIYRMFSRNIYLRRRENERFKGVFRSVKNFFVLQKNRIRDIRKYRYRKCKKCKSVLRLPIKKGTHTVVCPCCKNRFEVKVNI